MPHSSMSNVAPGSLHPRIGRAGVATALVAAVIGTGAVAQGVLVGLSDSRTGSITANASGMNGDFNAYTVSPQAAFQPVSFNESITIGSGPHGAGATLNTSSGWNAHQPPTNLFESFHVSANISYFTVSNGPSASSQAQNLVTAGFEIHSLPPGQMKPMRLAGSASEGAATLLIELRKGSTVLFSRSGSAAQSFDETFQLDEGAYTLIANIVGNSSQSGQGILFFSRSMDVTLTDLSPSATVCGEGSSCLIPQLSPYCSDPVCCAFVCDVDPSCCAVQWDLACATMAQQNCNIVAVSRRVRNPDSGFQYQLHGAGNWFLAKMLAESLGGQHVTIRNAGDDEWMFFWMANHNTVPRNLWLGIQDLDDNGSYEWISGEPVTYTNWEPGQPVIPGPGIGRMRFDTGEWTIDGSGQTPFSAFEFRHAACAADAGDCFVANGTPGCAISSCCHVVCEFDPFCCAAGWDATCAQRANDNCAPHVVAGPFPYQGEWYYRLSRSAATEAQKVARSFGGNLVTIDSFPKNQFVRQVVGDAGGGALPRLWIGTTDEPLEGFFRWMSGSTSTYANWASGEPNNFLNQEHFVEMYADGTWNDNRNTPTAAVHGVIQVPPACGLPGISDCFSVATFPYCTDPVCCEAVCFWDPFCCATQWDSICVGWANAVCVVPCPADLDESGAVDGADLGVLLSNWGNSGVGDINGDGIVDGADLGALLNAWGACG